VRKSPKEGTLTSATNKVSAKKKEKKKTKKKKTNKRLDIRLGTLTQEEQNSLIV
jgi:hypothetical protein